MAFCAATYAGKRCNTPLDMPEVHSIDGENLICAVCYEMWLAIAGNPYMIMAQDEYLKEVRNIQRLRLGANYFG